MAVFSKRTIAFFGTDQNPRPAVMVLQMKLICITVINDQLVFW
jgi:hypothetical protein